MQANSVYLLFLGKMFWFARNINIIKITRLNKFENGAIKT